MGVFSRSDSPYWWLWLETTHTKERTEIRVGTTASHRHDSKRLAEDRYHQRMNELAARLYRLPSAQPAIRFSKYAEHYLADAIAVRRGAIRETRILKNLVADLGDELLSSIDADRVRLYMRRRRDLVSGRTVNREIDLLKSMLRDAAPKYLTASPIVGLKRLPIVQPKRRLLAESEERKLLRVGDSQDRALLILGIDTLVRLGDLLDLQRRDQVGLWLYIRDPKGGDPYEVALSKRAAAALKAIPGNAPYFFAKFRKAENPRDWANSVKQRLERLCEQVDVPYGRKQGGITFHWATRRTGATRLLMGKGVPVPVVQRHGNWKTADVLLEIYAEAGKNDLLRAVGQLPRHSQSRRKRA